MRRGSRKNRVLDFWVGIPALNVLAIFRRRRVQAAPRQPARLGVMCSPALGDTLLLSAVLADLRSHYPDAEIVHFCMRSSVAAAEIIDGADRRVVLDLTKPVATVRKLRAERLDLLLDFSAWQRITAFYSMLSGARFGVGFRTPGQHRGRAYDLAVAHRPDCHEAENFRNVLRALGIPTGREPGVTLPERSSKPLPEERELIVFHPWASGSLCALREWPEDRWIVIARELALDAHVSPLFVVTGGPGDRQRTNAFVARMEQHGLRSVAFIGEDGFVALGRMLRRARLLISVNTGVMHLGAIVGTPTLGLNGPTADHRWGPRGRCAEGINPSDGSGGYLHLGFEFDGQPADVMERITVAQVTEAARDLMRRCPPVETD